MSEPYDYEPLWFKAKLFVNRAMDDDDTSDDERMLWASLALELLAKAALARVSPLLVAVPNEEGANLLVAIGLAPRTRKSKFATVAAATLYKRCERAFRPFSAEQAERITSARNEYLHGSDVGFGDSISNWWPRYWSLASILVTAMDRELSDFVGPDRSPWVEGHLEQNDRNVEEQTEALVERARQRFEQHKRGQLPAKLAAEWAAPQDLTIGMLYRNYAGCPACGGLGLLEGSNVGNSEIIWPDESNSLAEPIEMLYVDADYFSCPNCRLVLRTYEYLEHAGIDTTFDIENEDYDPLLAYDEPDYGND